MTSKLMNWIVLISFNAGKSETHEILVRIKNIWNFKNENLLCVNYGGKYTIFSDKKSCHLEISEQDLRKKANFTIKGKSSDNGRKKKNIK